MSNPTNSQKSLALIGEFMVRWSQMEQYINLSISAGTKLSPLMNTVVCANLTIREKLNILRTLLDISNIEDERKKQLKAVLRAIGEYTTTRNMIAHDFMAPVEDDTGRAGVGFMTIKAKGNFDTPFLFWDDQRFREEYKKIWAFQKELEQVMVWLENSTFSSDRLDIPMQIVNSPARPNPHAPLPQESPGSDPAIPETSVETPPHSSFED